MKMHRVPCVSIASSPVNIRRGSANCLAVGRITHARCWANVRALLCFNSTGCVSHECRHHDPECHQALQQMSSRSIELDLTVPSGLALRVYRAQRVGQDDDVADDHAHPASRRGRDRGAGRARHAGRARLRQLSSRRARALQADVGAPAVAVLRRLEGAAQPELDRSIDDWLERLGLSAWIDKKIDSLSKGMAQKVQFIAAVLNKPRLLILDEPFSGLDPVNAEVLKDAVLDLKKAGTTIVFSTHDMQVAERLCDRIFMIFKGQKVLDGTLDEIQSNLRLRHDSPARPTTG